MVQYFGKFNEVETAEITASVAVVNPDNLKSRFVEKVTSLASVTSASIFISFGGALKNISTMVFYGHNGTLESSARLRFNLFDGENGTGSLVNQSPLLFMDRNYQTGSAFGEASEPAQVLHDFTVQSGDRLVPLASQCKSVEISLLTSFAFAWRVGYVWLGTSVALSELARLGAETAPKVQIKSRPQQTQGGGVAFQDDENISLSRLEYPMLSIADAETLEDLSKSVGTSAPFYFRRHPETSPPLSRKAEGGIVRLTEGLNFKSLGAQVNNPLDKVTMSATNIAVWR